MIYLRFEVLDVGQGLANFVEIYINGVLTTTMLLDIGTEREKHPSAVASVEDVVRRLGEMDHPNIAALVFSHKDKDHLSLLKPIIDQFKTPTGSGSGRTLTIDGIFHSAGLPDYNKAWKGNVIRQAAQHFDPTARTHIGRHGFPYRSTHFRQSMAEKQFWPWPGVVEQGEGNWQKPLLRHPELSALRLSALIVNVDSTRDIEEAFDTSKKAKLDPNAGSLVTVLSMKQKNGNDLAYVVTGDATALTLDHATSPRIARLHTLRRVYHVTAPHHGSFVTTLTAAGAKERRTLRAVLRAKRKKKTSHDWILNADSAAALSEFVESLRAETISASADVKEEWAHPAMMVLYYFRRYLKGEFIDPGMSPHHFITAYFDAFGEQMQFDDPEGSDVDEDWPPKQSYATVQVAKAIFTTRYILRTPPGVQTTQDLFYDVDVRTVSYYPRRHPDAYTKPESVNWLFDAIHDMTAPQDGPLPIALRVHDEALVAAMQARVEAIAPERIGPRLLNAHRVFHERVRFPSHVRRIG
jgi:hypothetical protein